MDGDTVITLIDRAEKNALLSLSLHGLLTEKGLQAEARIAWVLHLNASANAEQMGDHLGVAVVTA